MISEKINYLLNWGDDTPIDKIRRDLDAIESLGATHVDIYYQEMIDCVTLEIDAIKHRKETKNEIAERMANTSRYMEDTVTNNQNLARGILRIH